MNDAWRPSKLEGRGTFRREACWLEESKVWTTFGEARLRSGVERQAGLCGKDPDCGVPHELQKMDMERIYERPFFCNYCIVPHTAQWCPLISLLYEVVVADAIKSHRAIQ